MDILDVYNRLWEYDNRFALAAQVSWDHGTDLMIHHAKELSLCAEQVSKLLAMIGPRPTVSEPLSKKFIRLVLVKDILSGRVDISQIITDQRTPEDISNQTSPELSFGG
ncbi:MAG: hypothetical protein S4CHLAM20_03980 [Chlamydiia bacterium]|nr:hypothetical protein [Chlamydiia bacterium]